MTERFLVAVGLLALASTVHSQAARKVAPKPIVATTQAEATTRLFDTATSAKACTDAMVADLSSEIDTGLARAKGEAAVGKKPGADEICDAGTLVKLAPSTSVRILKKTDSLRQVSVRAGKNTGKRGWVHAGELTEVQPAL